MTSTTSRSPAAPVVPARRLDLVETLHGRAVPDPYRWLEDAGSEETQAWSEAQDALVRAHLDALPGREQVRSRLTALLSAGLVGAPAWRGDRSFWLRRSGEQEHAVLLTSDAPGAGERVLLDPGALDPQGLTTLDAWQPSKEGLLLAHQLSEGGDEESTLRVLDVTTGETVDGPIDRTRYSPVAWLPGGQAYYYVRRLTPEAVPDGEEQFHRRVWLHRVGSDPAEDVMVHGEGLDPTNYYGVSVSLDGRWLAVSASAGTAPRTDVWLADLRDSSVEAPALRPVQVGVDARTSVSVGRDGRLYVFTDRDAPRGRLCVADPESPAYESWRELVPEDPEAVLEDYEVLDGLGLDRPLLAVARTRHGVGELSLLDLADGTTVRDVALPGLGSVGGLSGRIEGGHELWFGWTDHVTPPRVLHLDARSGAVTVHALPPGQVDVPAVAARQVEFASADGTTVRMFVLARAADLAADGKPTTSRPAILYGYGGFGIAMTPGYSASILAWVEAGGVYAVAGLRGGSEEGESWHRDGMRQHKHHVFEDLEAAADALVAGGWTTHEQLGVSGGSNGGLLVGAALTRSPERYAAVVCSAPLLDMVRYERFGLGRTWNDEYGTADDPDELGWLLSYSPYHAALRPAPYPAVLFTVFDSDTRVDPLHARKTCAALQASTTSGRPVLLRRERDVGHGARSVSRTIGLSVDTAVFLADALGLGWPDGA
ncbi:MAG: prolyl oligopeptidase family serine peptidase [Actinomycetota bacterium]|nr:prolyl oligopeptidase family serine peptidase [Actinomycetota bacterium]